MKIGDRVRYSEAGLRKSPAGPGMSARQYAETLRGTVTDLDYYKGDRAQGILHVLWDGNSRDTRVSVSDVESVSRANPRKKAAKKNPSRKGMVKVKAHYRHVPGGAAKAARKSNPRRRNPVPSWTAADAVYRKAQKLLEKANAQEAAAQIRSHVKRGHKVSTFRYSPPDYIREWIAALDRGDEETIKYFNMTYA